MTLGNSQTPTKVSRKPLITGFVESLSKEVCDNVVKSATKSCFQSVEHSRSGEKCLPMARVSPNTSFVLTSLAACFISEWSTLEAGLIY